jgi:hypothetical protein
LVRFVFKAESRKNVTKVGTTKASTVPILNKLGADKLAELINAPPLLEGKQLLQPPAALNSGSAFHLTFGNVGVELPDGMVPVEAPDWLEDATTNFEESGGRLKNKYILFNWGDSTEPQWLVGKLGVPGRYKDFGTEGNFKAFYSHDNEWAVHDLNIEEYATSATSDNESWVLLGAPPSGAAASTVAAPLVLTMVASTAASAAPESAPESAPEPVPEPVPEATPLPNATKGKRKRGAAGVAAETVAAPSTPSLEGLTPLQLAALQLAIHQKLHAST